MQAIRDDKLYPGAESDSQTVKAAWKSYCKDRWSMSPGIVHGIIQALPVFRRLASDAVGRQLPSVSAAASVATLPEQVQDEILDNTAQAATRRFCVGIACSEHQPRRDSGSAKPSQPSTLHDSGSSAGSVGGHRRTSITTLLIVASVIGIPRR